MTAEGDADEALVDVTGGLNNSREGHGESAAKGGSGRQSTRARAHGIGVKGLMNVQYALKDDILYVIEANPRASRTTFCGCRRPRNSAHAHAVSLG